jgi:hypothetical protein
MDYIHKRVDFRTRFSRPGGTDSYLRHTRLEYVREIKEQMCQILEIKVNELKFNDTTDRSAFELPDKERLDIGI